MADRAETGRMQFGVDWPGIFIRGDQALGFAGALRSIIALVRKPGDDARRPAFNAAARSRGNAG